jgi:cyanamide hydratase
MSLSKDGAYGWQAAARDVETFVASTSAGTSASDTCALLRARLTRPSEDSTPIDASTISLPEDPISQQLLVYARNSLSPQTLNHSLRIYLFGHVIASQHFPDLLRLKGFLEAYYASCLLHDIGTTDSNIASSKMSFEFSGAIVAMNVLREYGAAQDLVEQVGEVIIRHQDVGTTGTQTAVGALIHVTTLLGKLCKVYKVDYQTLTT